MRSAPIDTSNPDVRLIEPDIERDAALGVAWLDGELGRNTLRLMGVTDAENHATTLDEERDRVRGFIENQKQLNWMIHYEDSVVGAIWVNLEPTHHLQAPSLHIMIGDPTARGKGIGSASTAAVITYLSQNDYHTMYSRYLDSNAGSRHLLEEQGFELDGQPYADNDGLRWQNVRLGLQ